MTGPASRARVVSLVPSVTETLLAWGVTPVGVTRFCEQPTLNAVGGTKNPDIDRIIALAPDLVVLNDEENRREDADALAAAGIPLLVLVVRSVEAVAPELVRLADAVGVDPSVASASEVGPMAGAADANAPRTGGTALRAFMPIWRRPWMSLNADTYGSSVLDHLGIVNVCGDRPERYPEVAADDLPGLAADVVLLPTEPYPFVEKHRAEAEAVVGAPSVLVDGQDLFWWGSRTPAALNRLGHALATLDGSHG